MDHQPLAADATNISPHPPTALRDVHELENLPPLSDAYFSMEDSYRYSDRHEPYPSSRSTPATENPLSLHSKSFDTRYYSVEKTASNLASSRNSRIDGTSNKFQYTDSGYSSKNPSYQMELPVMKSSQHSASQNELDGLRVKPRWYRELLPWLANFKHHIARMHPKEDEQDFTSPLAYEEVISTSPEEFKILDHFQSFVNPIFAGDLEQSTFSGLLRTNSLSQTPYEMALVRPSSRSRVSGSPLSTGPRPTVQTYPPNGFPKDLCSNTFQEHGKNEASSNGDTSSGNDALFKFEGNSNSQRDSTSEPSIAASIISEIDNRELVSKRQYNDRIISSSLFPIGKKKFTCPFQDCRQSYEGAEYLSRHLYKHNATFPCDVPGCQGIFFQYESYIRHKKTHKDSSGESSTCSSRNIVSVQHPANNLDTVPMDNSFGHTLNNWRTMDTIGTGFSLQSEKNTIRHNSPENASELSHVIKIERSREINDNNDSQNADPSVGFNTSVTSGKSITQSIDMKQVSGEKIDNILGSIIEQVQGLLLNCLNDYAISEATDGIERSDKRPRESNSSSSSQSSGSSSPNSESQRQKRLHEKDQDPGDDDDESGDDDDNDHPKGSRKLTPFRLPRRLKCPFYQRKPEKYSRAACRGEGFADMAKLKDHIKRVHTQSLRCARCWMEMKNEEAYSSHLQAEVPCERQKQPMDDRITYQTLKRLDFKKAPYAQAKNTEGKWKILYTVLFPNDTDIPSPYEQHGFTPKLERVLHEALEEELARELAPALEPILRRIKDRIPAIIQSCKLKILSASLDGTAWSESPGSEAPSCSKKADFRRRKAGEMSNADDEQEMAKKNHVPKRLATRQPFQDHSPFSTGQSIDDPLDSRHASSPDSIFDYREKLSLPSVCEQTPPSTARLEFPKPMASNIDSERRLECLKGVTTSQKLSLDAQRQVNDTLNKDHVQQVPDNPLSFLDTYNWSDDFDMNHPDLDPFVFD